MVQVKTQRTIPELVKPLEPVTWSAFAQSVEDNNGVRGGCWCMGFHAKLGTCQIAPHRWVVTKIAAVYSTVEQP